MRDRDETAEHVDQGRRDEERRDTARSAVFQHDGVFLDRRQAAYKSATQRTDQGQLTTVVDADLSLSSPGDTMRRYGR